MSQSRNSFREWHTSEFFAKTEKLKRSLVSSHTNRFELVHFDMIKN